MDVAEQPRRLLGLLLIEMGLISEDQLAQALNAQKRTGELLGEVLVARGYVTRLAIQDALALQRGVLLKPDPGFGGGLRGELIRRESRTAASVDHKALGSRGTELGKTDVPEASIAGHRRQPQVGRQNETELEQELKRDLTRLSTEVGRHEQRLAELERELETARHDLAKALRGMPSSNVPAIGLGQLESWPAESLSEPFLATVGRARKHITARRAALRALVAVRF